MLGRQDRSRRAPAQGQRKSHAPAMPVSMGEDGVEPARRFSVLSFRLGARLATRGLPYDHASGDLARRSIPAAARGASHERFFGAQVLRPMPRLALDTLAG